MTGAVRLSHHLDTNTSRASSNRLVAHADKLRVIADSSGGTGSVLIAGTHPADATNVSLPDAHVLLLCTRLPLPPHETHGGRFGVTEPKMKKTLLAAAAAALCMTASSAFAQSYDLDLGAGTITQWYDNGNNLHPNPSPNVPDYGYGPYAQLPRYYDCDYGPGIFYDPRVIERR
jgi:hypothetical protein